MATNNNWYAPGAGGFYGTGTSYGGGAGGITTSSRDVLDYLRRGSPGRTPEAEYPDGYLSTTNSRNQDKLVQAVKGLNSRSYTRGVHKGERIDPSDYAWPVEWNPQTSVKAEARGMRTSLAYTGNVEPNPRGILPPPAALDPHKAQQLSRFSPPWS
jgi:hypothetical protein